MKGTVHVGLVGDLNLTPFIWNPYFSVCVSGVLSGTVFRRNGLDFLVLLGQETGADGPTVRDVGLGGTGPWAPPRFGVDSE